MTFEQKLEKKELVKDIRKLGNQIAILLLTIVAVTNVIYIGINKLFPDFYEKVTAVVDEMNFSLIIQFFLVMLPALLIASKVFGMKLTSFIRKPEIKFGSVLKWFVIGFFLSTTVNLFIQLIVAVIEMLTETSMGEVAFIAERDPLNAVIFAFFVVIGAPIFEELYFRGLFLSKLMKYGSVFAVVVTGLMFGLYHMNLPQIFPAAILGLVFAFVTVKSRSILPAMLMHLMNNTIGCAGQLIAGGMDVNKIASGDTAYMMEQGGAYLGLMCLGFAIMMLLGAGLVLLIIQLASDKKRAQINLGEQKAPELKLSEKFGAFISSPGIIVMIVVMIASTAVTIMGLEIFN